MKWEALRSINQLSDKHEVKLNNGKVKSIGSIVGVTILNNSNQEIDYDSIFYFREKKDWNRYNELQKHFNTLNSFDTDDFEYAVSNGLGLYYNDDSLEEFNKVIKVIKEWQEKAISCILKESKEFLKH